MTIAQNRSQHRHELILDAASRVFSQRGYHATAMDDIALESRTSKGGLYFHFPNKQTLFVALLDRMAALLRSRVESAIAAETDPLHKADVALRTVLQTFASHRTLARLFLVEALAAGREFHERMAALHTTFAVLIQAYLDEAVEQGAIAPLDTATAGRAWFGALNEVVMAWLQEEPPGPLEERYVTLRALLLGGVGVSAERISRMDLERNHGSDQR